MAVAIGPSGPNDVYLNQLNEFLLQHQENIKINNHHHRDGAPDDFDTSDDTCTLASMTKALQEPHLDAAPQKQRQTYKNFGVNHVALIVSNIQAIERKLQDAGYRKGIETPVEKHRKRAYFYDNAGFEWELRTAARRVRPLPASRWHRRC